MSWCRWGGRPQGSCSTCWSWSRPRCHRWRRTSRWYRSRDGWTLRVSSLDSRNSCWGWRAKTWWSQDESTCCRQGGETHTDPGWRTKIEQKIKVPDEHSSQGKSIKEICFYHVDEVHWTYYMQWNQILISLIKVFQWNWEKHEFNHFTWNQIFGEITQFTQK